MVLFVSSILSIPCVVLTLLAGLMDAYELYVFHRDVSVRNVMIRDKTNPFYSKYSRVRSVGILNDWDHAIKFHPRSPVHEYRTVSLPFYLSLPLELTIE